MPSGFKNTGNTCYMNACLKILSALKPFSWGLRHCADIPTDSMAQALLLVIVRSAAEFGSVDAARLKQILGGRFRNSSQQDAHEFLIAVLDLVEEELATTKVPLVPHPRCPVATNFSLKLRQTRTCTCCKQQSSVAEQCRDLKLDIPVPDVAQFGGPSSKPPSVEQLLSLFFQPQEVEYTCESCGSTASTCSRRITSLPRVLLLQVKRFRYDPVAAVRVKISAPIFIPAVAWNLSCYPQCTLPPLAYERTLTLTLP